MPQEVENDSITEPSAYLMGLICGRGHFFDKERRIAVEFAHKNKKLNGIAHCPDCGDLATGFKEKTCKSCGKTVSENLINEYEQVESTKRSLKRRIIPFLKNRFKKAEFSLLGNDKMTILVIDFSKKKRFSKIRENYEANSFDSFRIPELIKQSKKQVQTEFINGLFDTAGFPAAGNWLPRNGENGHGRMRMYFQIVRNWYITVDIDNFLRKHFSLPIQTIDWGHPNIRDSNLRDYFNSNATSWAREHQVKFFPEYYTQFKFRLKHKQKLFEELLLHNKKMVFSRKSDWFPPSKVRKNQLKAYHPGEDDKRIPQPARKHVDKFWQVNEALGCKFLQKYIRNSDHPECLVITGEDESCNPEKTRKEYDRIRKEKTKEKYEKHEKQSTQDEVSTESRTKSNLLEEDLYTPISNWLEGYLKNDYQKPISFDTSAESLDLFIENRSLAKNFDFYSNFKIRPDVVGFLPKINNFVFVEVKIQTLSLEHLGQLIGYCLVAKPEKAILVSNKKPSVALQKAISSNPSILEYADNKKIKIGLWDNGEIIF